MRVLILVFIFFGTTYAEFLKSENIVVDTNTNLMWQDNIESTYQEDITLSDVYCKELILNGYIDWRLPTIKELQGIMNQKGEKNYLEKKFAFIKEGKYWSITPNVIKEQYYWYVDFKEGRVANEDKRNRNSIRCVRDVK